jgi:histidinol-phosphate/aromatic aminotransferase/cobyric acid decarboxylase-like protein
MAIKAPDGRHLSEVSPELSRRMAMRVVNVPTGHQEAAFAAVQAELEAMKKSAADVTLARQWVDATMEEIGGLVSAIEARSKTSPRMRWGR